MATQQVGRFEIQRTLGKGGQGAVYLANDPQLDRLVAIKAMHKAGPQASAALTNEARIVSKLQHPNIITLFDCGEHRGVPYLVYAYVPGQTLSDLLKQERVLSLVRAAEIASGILQGLGYAHQQNIIHLDIKPANIMMNEDGQAMVMDFGLARAVSQQQGQDNDFALNGTPRYVAPELVAGKPGTVLSDVYAVGAILYEMVTGQYAIEGEGVYEVLNKVANEPVIQPSTYNERIDEVLESVILKALAKDPGERFRSAGQMLKALHDYLGNAQEVAEPVDEADNSTLEFLLRRMRTKQDFPAISGSIAEINRIVSSESASGSKLASAILQDFSLTSKLLKLVNAATYGQFGGKINTISKAVVVLGFETVRSIASSLMVIDFLQNKPQAAQLKDEIANAILSSVVALQLAEGESAVRDTEELMVCTMFYNLGKLLTTYYFFDESQEIIRLVQQGSSEESAAIKVLGISYGELGIGVARSWNFSHRMLTSMHQLKEIKKPEGELPAMAITVNLANDLCNVAQSGKNKAQALGGLIKRYSAARKLTEKDLLGALERGLTDFRQRSSALGIRLGRCQVLDKVRRWHGKMEDDGPTSTRSGGVLEDIQLEKSLNADDSGSFKITPDAILSAGAQDVSNTIVVPDFKLNDALLMILETIYRAMNFHRAVLLIRDNKRQEMVARYGFGEGFEQLKSRFTFPLASQKDVFHLAIEDGVDIAISNTRASNIEAKIPAWYWKAVNAPCFMLLPAMVKGKTICMFYADMAQPDQFEATQQQLALLRTLRNQAILAIKQKI